jgi:hypothetical protein
MDIELEELKAATGNLTDEQVFEELLGLKVKQKISTAKFYNKDSNRKSRQKKAKKQADMVAFAKSRPATRPGFASLYDQILAEAAEAAKDQVAAAKAQREQGEAA